jgi:lipopolysaccharide export system protein LptC
LTLNPADGAGPRSASALIRRQVRLHTRRVKVMRWLLPTLIMALIGLLAAFVIADALRTVRAKPVEAPTEIRMIGPHFIGRDTQGRAFNLAARQAVRDNVNMRLVELISPVIVMDAESPHPKTLTADKGVYDEDSRKLKLNGHVRVDDSTASTVATNDAEVDTRAGTVSGVSAIAGNGPMGNIRASSYSASQKGQVVNLRGGVHAELKAR